MKVVVACCTVSAAFALLVPPQSRSPSRVGRGAGAGARVGAAEDVFDAIVCGAGPSGLALAAELATRGASVCVCDPRVEQVWPNNYGVWMDEVEELGYADCCDFIWPEATVVFQNAEQSDAELANITLRRPYGRIDRVSLKERLLGRCLESGSARVVANGAIKVEHFEQRSSEVTLDDGSVLRASLVVDATGFSRKFVRHEVAFDPGFQVTYGILAEVETHPFPLDKLMLMDYRDDYLTDAAARASNDRFPSFMYVMPLSATRIFFEETILVSRPLGDTRELEARLYQRLEKVYGVKVLRILESERAAIPMGGSDPVVPQRTLGCGSTASAIHPASGYMVARALTAAPHVAETLAPQLKALSGRASFRAGELDALAAVGWEATWPADERRQRDFMHFGFELLCDLSPGELRDFFAGFFKLPDALWEHFLSWRLSGVGHVYMGALVWWSCIPKRFMPIMLLKSLPFIFSRLVQPFASRSTALKTDSLYIAEKWAPERFFVYLEALRERITHLPSYVGGGAAPEPSSSLPPPAPTPMVQNGTAVV